MDNHHRTNDPEKLKHHSLPGTNMAGKKAGDDCEKPDEQGNAPGAVSEKNRQANEPSTTKNE